MLAGCGLSALGGWFWLERSWDVDVPSGLYHVLTPKPVSATIAHETVPERASTVRFTGNLASPRLREASGLAQSNRYPGVFWAINDRGSPPEMFALDARGRHLGVWQLPVPNFDFEELAAFVEAGEPMLLVADTGDNLRWRRVLALHVIPEPDLDRAETEPVPVLRTIRYRYPDGYRDCEAVAVAGDSIFLISKRVTPAEVFRLPLAGGAGVLVAEPVADLRFIPQPTSLARREDPESWRFRSAPTALDIHDAHAIVMTPTDGYLYRRSAAETWPEAFGRIPERIVLPSQTGREAVAWLRESPLTFLIVAERFPTHYGVALFRVELEPMRPALPQSSG